ncbi:MAG: protein translocase subunit SecF [Actinomycetota bacterium]
MNRQRVVSAYRGHTIPHFRLVEQRNRWFLLSGIVIALSLVGLLFQHLNLSIDFKGGAQLRYINRSGASVSDVTAVLSANGHADSEVQIVNGDTISIRTTTLTNDATARDKLLSALASRSGINPNDISQQDVGPTWGSEISRKALVGLVVVLAAIFTYIWLRFEWKMALGANVALIHDLIITAGVYALVGRQVTPATVIAILTILGFSLYDTVVIYDKIKENTETSAMVAKFGYAETVNYSLNQVLMRSVNTSLVVLLPILSLLFFGGDTLKDFAFAMFVGVTTGAYSSIFIAAPVLALLKVNEPRYQQMEARRLVRTGKGQMPKARGAVVTEGETEDNGEAVAPVPAAASAAAATRVTARTGGPSRPRAKNKRKPPAKRKRR